MESVEEETKWCVEAHKKVDHMYGDLPYEYGSCFPLY
jgi:hypothetical protein